MDFQLIIENDRAYRIRDVLDGYALDESGRFSLKMLLDFLLCYKGENAIALLTSMFLIFPFSVARRYGISAAPEVLSIH